MGWFFFIAPDQSYADEVTVQVSPAPSETSTVTIQVTAQIAVETAQAAVTEAQTTVQSIDTQSNSLTNPTTVDQAIAQAQTAIDNVNQNIQTVMTTMTDLGTANNNVSLQQIVVESATASVSQAETAVTQATQEVSTATAQVATDTQALQTANETLNQAQTNLTNAQTTLTQASAAVDAQEPVVATAQTNKDAAQAVVNANTSPGLTVTVYSNPGTNASPTMGGNVVYTGTDTNGINEQYGSGGPTVNSGTVTVTETFNNNQLNTNIGITVNGTPVSTTNNSGVYIGSIGFPGGSDPSLNLYQPSATTTITMPSGTTSAGFAVFAKNGNTTGTVTYTDGTTETYILQDDVNANYPNYVHQETFIAPAGKTIATVTIPTDWDYFAVDNVTATKPGTAVVTEDFQVRWQGLWTPQYTGTQYITAPADDGVRLYLDGQLVIDDWVDKGGGGSTADVLTTAGVAKTFDMWYYENGGGANVSLQRYTGSGWEVIPASEFSTSTATPTQLATLATAIQTLNTEQATLTTLQQAETNAQNVVIDKTNVVTQQTLVVQTAQNDLQISNNILQTSQQNLTTANENLTTANQNLTTEQQNLTNLQSIAQTTEISASVAISNLNTSVQTMQTAVINAQSAQNTQSSFEQQQRAAAAAAAAAAAYVPPTPEPPVPVEPTPPIDTPEDPTEPEPETPVDPTPEEPSDNPSTDTPTDTTDTTDTTDSTDQTNSDTTDTDSSNEDTSSSDNTDTPSQPSDPVDTPTDNTPSEPQPTVDPTPEPSPQEHSTPESTPGLVENNPNSLPETTPKLPDASQLVAKVQVDKPGVENGGIEFFGTKSQPQVIGEDGKLTPPPPPPGSGLPIPPDAITITETFIGQPGGTTFNAPDVAVPVIIKPICVTIKDETGKEIHVDSDGNEHPIEACTFLPAALDAIPGAAAAMEALNAIYGDMANLGNDMSPVTRKKAKKILLATIVVGQIAAFRRRFGE